MLLLCACAALSGCLGRAAGADEYGYALCLGIDKGEDKTYEYTILMLNSGGQEDRDELVPIKAKADSLRQAKQLLSATITEELDMTRVQIVALSAAAASDAELMRGLIRPHFENAGIGMGAHCLVTRGNAAGYLEALAEAAKSGTGKLPLDVLRLNRGEGSFPQTTLSQLLDAAQRGGTAVLPLGEASARKNTEGGAECSLTGAAVISGGVFRLELDEAETLALLAAAGRFEGGGLALPNGGFANMSPAGARKIELDFAVPRAEISAALSFDTAAEDSVAALEYMNDTVVSLSEKLISVGAADAYRLRESAARYFANAREYEDYPWEDWLGAVNISVQFIPEGGRAS